MAIITSKQLQDYMGLPAVNDKVVSAVDAVNTWVEAYTQRVFIGAGEPPITITEKHDYAPVIFLEKDDIQSVDSVSINGKQVDMNSLVIDKDTGRIRLSVYGDSKYGRQFFDAVEVIYKVGTTAPDDLILACLQLASDNYNRKDTAEGDIQSESVGGYSKTYGGSVSVQGSNVVIGNSADYMAVFNFYRRVHL